MTQTPATPQPEEQAPVTERPCADPGPADLRGATTTRKDQSAHRRHTWLYEDMLA